MAERQRINSGTIRVNRLIISISRSLENEDKEKVNPKPTIPGIFPQKKTQFWQQKQNPGIRSPGSHIEIEEYLF